MRSARRACRRATCTLLTRQRATLAQSGMPLDQALAAVAEQADDAARRAGRRRRCARTSRPANRCRRRSRAFRARSPPLYRGLVGGGCRKRARWRRCSSRLADYLEARQALRQKLTVALDLSGAGDGRRVRRDRRAARLRRAAGRVRCTSKAGRRCRWLTQALIATREFLRATGWLWLARRDRRCRVAFAVACRSEAFARRMHALAAAHAGGRPARRAASTPRASRARLRSSPAAARRCCARSTRRPTSMRMQPLARRGARALRRSFAKACRWRAR